MNVLAINNFEDILLESSIGILVVFIALVLLVIAFNATGKLSKKSVQSKNKKSGTKTETVEHKPDLTGDEVAAISMALHLFLNDIHDEESNIITIKRIERRYSPWNSKIYGLTNIIR